MESIDFKKKLKQINELLEKGEVPDCLNYTASNRQNCNINWDMLLYNSYYKSLKYSKDKLDEKIENQNILLEEYNKKKNEIVHSER